MNRNPHESLCFVGICVPYYIIPSDNRELQHVLFNHDQLPIISYQVITGNYNIITALSVFMIIISYQVITGNYNCTALNVLPLPIISYQVITGNYNSMYSPMTIMPIISYQVITGNYNITGFG